jgi:hypothetical protein
MFASPSPRRKSAESFRDENSALLPFHFDASGLASAVSVLQLTGHDDKPALRVLVIASAAAEAVIGARIELERQPAVRPLKSRTAGGSGEWKVALWPVAATASAYGGSQRKQGFYNFRQLAAVSSIAGSALRRFAWIKAGQASARDPRSIPSKPVDQQSLKRA